MGISLNDLRAQYQNLFDTCVVSTAGVSAANQIIGRILPNQPRYQNVGGPLGIPWYVVAVIHNMECSLNFNQHLHNGDPLTARTVHVPRGRPVTGNPPFTWEASATDALQFDDFANHTDWSLPAILFRLEAYNGFGYRRLTPPIMTPYLWSLTNHYVRGKFSSDGVFNPNAVSSQCGAAVILFMLAKGGVISFPVGAVAAASAGSTPASTSSATPPPGTTPPGSAPSATAPAGTTPVGVSTAGAQLAAEFDSVVTFSNSEMTDAAKALQTALNKFPGINLDVDGFAGKGTSDAYKQVTGHFLKGDSRG